MQNTEKKDRIVQEICNNANAMAAAIQRRCNVEIRPGKDEKGIQIFEIKIKRVN